MAENIPGYTKPLPIPLMDGDEWHALNPTEWPTIRMTVHWNEKGHVWRMHIINPVTGVMVCDANFSDHDLQVLRLIGEPFDGWRKKT